MWHVFFLCLFCSPTIYAKNNSANLSGESNASAINTTKEPSVHVYQPLTGVSRHNTRDNNHLWVPPVGFDSELGKVTPQKYQDECISGDTKGYHTYPVNCLSTIVVETEVPYTATINIFDNTGKWIHSHVQKFGYCSELENENRKQPGGFVDFLVWNQAEDTRGTKVGSGVYVWKIVFDYADGRSIVRTFKQGIAREEKGQLDPALCAAY